MALSTAVSVASFSVVLTQSFAAVAASSLVPATFVTLARIAKGAAGAAGSGTPAASSTESTALVSSLVAGGDSLAKALKEVAKAVDSIDVLVPKTARITAEFEFEGSEAYAAELSAGAAVNVVSVSAGYSALYSTSSKNKIRLEVDFASVNYTL